MIKNDAVFCRNKENTSKDVFYTRQEELIIFKKAKY